MRILIVDDALFMRKLLAHHLIALGHEIVAEANDGEGALRQYQRSRPDLVTMDVTMPHVDGIAGLKLIRGVDPNARILMVSALGAGDRIQDALDHGAVGYVTKPFTREKIRRCLEGIKSDERKR